MGHKKTLLIAFLSCLSILSLAVFTSAVMNLNIGSTGGSGTVYIGSKWISITGNQIFWNEAIGNSTYLTGAKANKTYLRPQNVTGSKWIIRSGNSLLWNETQGNNTYLTGKKANQTYLRTVNVTGSKYIIRSGNQIQLNETATNKTYLTSKKANQTYLTQLNITGSKYIIRSVNAVLFNETRGNLTYLTNSKYNVTKYQVKANCDALSYGPPFNRSWCNNVNATKKNITGLNTIKFNNKRGSGGGDPAIYYNVGVGETANRYIIFANNSVPRVDYYVRDDGFTYSYKGFWASFSSNVQLDGITTNSNTIYQNGYVQNNNLVENSWQIYLDILPAFVNYAPGYINSELYLDPSMTQYAANGALVFDNQAGSGAELAIQVGKTTDSKENKVNVYGTVISRDDECESDLSSTMSCSSQCDQGADGGFCDASCSLSHIFNSVCDKAQVVTVITGSVPQPNGIVTTIYYSKQYVGGSICTLTPQNVNAQDAYLFKQSVRCEGAVDRAVIYQGSANGFTPFTEYDWNVHITGLASP